MRTGRGSLMRGTRLVIAGRHPIVLQGLTSVFAPHRDFEIVASCHDGASCVEAIRSLAPDVALLEDSLPDLTASEVLAIANAENLSTRLVFFTASVEQGDLAAAIAAGACSAISKYASLETLLQSLRLVARGIRLLPEPSPDLAPTGKEVNGASIESMLAVLTDREREIMRLVSEGLSNKAVARRLNISQGTIKVHLHHIYQKLEINNRTVLAALAISQRYGGSGTLLLAALISAAMDDVQAADPNATFLDDDNAPKTFTAVSSPRSSTGGYGTLMITAAGAWTYNETVPTLNARDTLTDSFMVTTVDDTAQVVTVTTHGSSDAGPNNFDHLALGDHEISDPPFVFGTLRGDRIAGGGGEFQIVYAGAGEDTINGTGKDDPLYAGSGNDTIYGGSGTLNGNNGADTIIGGFGGDRLKGSNGDDTFVYLAVADSSSAQFDTITDFKSGSDRINLAAFGALAFMALSLTATTVSPHTIAWIYDSANNQTIVYVNQTDRTLNIGDSALLEMHLQGVAYVAESDFVYEPATATVAATSEGIDPALAAMAAGDALKESSADASVDASLSEIARVTDSIWTTADESFSFHFARERVDSIGSARFVSFGKTPAYATENGGSDAVTLASASSVERSHATVPMEDHFAFDHAPIHASAAAMTTGDAAVIGPSHTIDHGACAVATATAASQHADHGVAPESAANHGQSQRDLHAASEDASAAADQHADHGVAPESAANHGQSQRDLHAASEEASAAADQHAAHGATPGGGANHGQSQRDLHAASKDASAAAEQHVATPGSGANHGQSQRDLPAASDNGPAVAEQHAAHGATPANGTNPGQSQRDLHAASADASNNSHSGSNPNAASKDQPASADAGPAEMAAAPALGDSFHFKSEMAASKHSDTVELADLGNGPASTAHDRHVGGHDGWTAIQDTESAGLSLPEQNADDHARGAQHHVPHDLIV
jgi:VCBS repeat-containing protein